MKKKRKDLAEDQVGEDDNTEADRPELAEGTLGGGATPPAPAQQEELNGDARMSPAEAGVPGIEETDENLDGMIGAAIDRAATSRTSSWTRPGSFDELPGWMLDPPDQPHNGGFLRRAVWVEREGEWQLELLGRRTRRQQSLLTPLTRQEMEAYARAFQEATGIPLPRKKGRGGR